jgi:hypothetical protein
VPNEEMGGRLLPQPPDVAATVVIVVVAGFLGFVALTMAGAFFFLKAGAPDALRRPVEHRFPEPVLQKDPQADLKRFELEQRMALSGHGWVDRQQGLVRIPIDEAMRIIAAQGEHAYDPPDPLGSAPNTGKPTEGRP